ncbi:MAG: hypothetical protein LBS35_11105 [Synergistaceae bacterium]|jgi:hypothetical protein|nr:hypothetical protein [Synergistaceae bacterium]
MKGVLCIYTDVSNKKRVAAMRARSIKKLYALWLTCEAERAERSETAWDGRTEDSSSE